MKRNRNEEEKWKGGIMNSEEYDLRFNWENSMDDPFGNWKCLKWVEMSHLHLLCNRWARVTTTLLED